MQRKVLLQLPLRRTNRGGATILKVGGQILRAERIIPKLCPPVRFGSKSLKVGGQILRAERIIPKLCPPVRFGSKSGGSCPPSSYGSAAHGHA